MESAVILIVDDELDTLEMLKIAVERGPFTAITASSGNEAIEKARSLKPALVILDIMMPPGIDGLEVCRVLRSGSVTKDIPIILLTAIASKLSMNTMEKTGDGRLIADDYIEKPTDPNHLLERVRFHLKR